MNVRWLSRGLALVFALAAISGPVVPRINVASQEGNTLRGTVKLRDTALSGVSVVAISTNSHQKKSAQTNESGEYEIKGLRGDVFLITVANTPYVLQESMGGTFRQVSVNETGVTTADLVLTEGGVVTGCVEYSSGQAVIGREVLAEEIGGSITGFSPLNFRAGFATDDRGCFRVFGIPTGEYRIGIGKAAEIAGTKSLLPFSVTYYPGVELRSQALIVKVAAAGEYSLGKLTLKSQKEMFLATGIFSDEVTNQTLPDFAFELVRYNANAADSTTQLASDEHGEFIIPDLFQGRYSIQPAVGHNVVMAHTFSPISFEVIDKDIYGLLVRCTSLTASLSGEVVINDSVLALDRDCTIALKEGESIDPSGGKIYRVPLIAGRFDLTGLRRGVYTMVVFPLRPTLQYEHAEVGTRDVRNPGAYGILRVELTTAEQTVKIFLKGR